MSEDIIYLRRNGVTRRFVGPHAEEIAALREAEGWERFAPDAGVLTPAAAPDVAASEPQASYTNRKVDDLKALLEERSITIPSDARKTDLIALLEADDVAQGEAPADDDTSAEDAA